MAKRRWLWILLFVIAVLILATLATAFNVVLVKDYRKLLELAHSVSHSELDLPKPWMSLIFGTIGFAGVLGGLILLFGRLLREMQLNQVQNEFLASVTHALKTPIATMELAGSLLRSGQVDPDEAQKLWHSHDAELARLKEEVEALLEATRWESAAVRLSRAPIKIEDWIKNSTNRWKQILGPNSEIKREGKELGCEAVIDLRALNLVTDNVFDNARKFAQGSPQVTIRAEYVPRRAPWLRPRWKLHIADQGLGFEPAENDRIFKRFYRSRTRAPYAIPGTGLGLYLAAQASKAMGLKLHAESEGLGKGATFTVEGPARW